MPISYLLLCSVSLAGNCGGGGGGGGGGCGTENMLVSTKEKLQPYNNNNGYLERLTHPDPRCLQIL